jgi:TolB-like protein/Tfp pilus assembly protein PilF
MNCWVAPRDVMPGELYADAIVHAIDAAKVVVLVLSRNAASSPHVLREVERATSKQHPVISLRIDAAPLPASLEYFLNTTQWLDASKGDVTDALPKLVDAVRRHLDHSSGSALHAQAIVPDRADSRAMSVLRDRWTVSVVVAVLALALTYFIVERFWVTGPINTQQSVAVTARTVAPAAATIPEKSIAVLPFTDMSEKHDQEYLADGMAEEIINLLAEVPDLLVPGRTSSFYFKGKQTKIPDIAHELGVAHVLEGSIRRSGDRLRVTAQLVRADNGYHLWSETYDRELRDVFEMQDDIANAVVQALQIKLAGGELSRQRGGTQNLEAYQLYLRAKSTFYQNTASSRDTSGEYLDQAINLDPSYGMAWALLASNALVTTAMGVLDPAQGVERVRQLAQHALQLSPDLAEAHATLVWAFMLTWDWAAAEAEGQRALAIDPTNPAALDAAGGLSLALGRWDDAERQYSAALTRDPLAPFMIDGLGDVYYKTGRYAEAEVMYRKALALAPGAPWYHQTIAYALLLQGKAEAALAMVQQDVDEGSRLYYLPIMLQANGRQAEADEALQAQIARWADRGAVFVAMSYAYRGDHDLALQWLERAYQQKDTYLWNIVGEPLLKNIADDPRYKAFLRKMKLPE